jgi:hypothetical protein
MSEIQIQVNTKNEKLGDDKKKIFYPGSRIFILEGGKVSGPDILKNPAKFVSYKMEKINQSKILLKEGGNEVIEVNGGTMVVDGNTVVVTSETKIENKEGQRRVFMTSNEKLAKELSTNTNIIERERLQQCIKALEAQVRLLDEIIAADSDSL